MVPILFVFVPRSGCCWFYWFVQILENILMIGLNYFLKYVLNYKPRHLIRLTCISLQLLPIYSYNILMQYQIYNKYYKTTVIELEIIKRQSEVQ